MPMDTNRPSPRQLQGPRPAPLKVRKDSYKITKKPPQIPQNPDDPSRSQHEQQPPPPPARPPVIIYTVSPKVIHTNPSDFMTLVQRLTGPDSAPSSSSSAAISPAARFAAIENADKFSPRNNNNRRAQEEEAEAAAADASTCCCWSQPGILSPAPSSLQPIPPSFFSPISSYDPASFAFLHDLSPGPNSAFLLSPPYLLPTPTAPSPGTAVWDLFF